MSNGSAKGYLSDGPAIVFSPPGSQKGLALDNPADSLLRTEAGGCVPDFHGRIRLLDDPIEAVGAGIEIIGDSLALIVSNREIGEWALADVDIEVDFDGFRLRIEGEEFVFETNDRAGFARAIGMAPSPVLTRAAPSPRPAMDELPPPEEGIISRLLNRIDMRDPRTVWIGGITIGVLLMAFFARPVLIVLLLLAGMAGAMVSAGAIVDPLLEARLPNSWPVTRVAVVSAIALAAGLLLLAF
jgi:hypothetical protein